jgi:hypothetical protein
MRALGSHTPNTMLKKTLHDLPEVEIDFQVTIGQWWWT